MRYQYYFVHAPAGAGPLAPDRGMGIPTEADATLKQRRALNALRQEMQAAVEGEDFERAAELRDEIDRLEQSA